MVNYEAWLGGTIPTPENYRQWLVDPNHPDAVFVALIEMREGVPFVGWDPDLGDEVRKYTILASPTLEKPVSKWREFESDRIPECMRFF